MFNLTNATAYCGEEVLPDWNRDVLRLIAIWAVVGSILFPIIRFVCYTTRDEYDDESFTRCSRTICSCVVGPSACPLDPIVDEGPVALCNCCFWITAYNIVLIASWVTLIAVDLSVLECDLEWSTATSLFGEYYGAFFLWGLWQAGRFVVRLWWFACNWNQLTEDLESDQIPWWVYLNVFNPIASTPPRDEPIITDELPFVTVPPLIKMRR